jgi:hypothetical protein
MSSSLTCLFPSANGPSKRKSTAENPHQSALIRIPSSRLRNQNIWAELLSGWVGSLHLTLQNAICPRAGALGGGCGFRARSCAKFSWLRLRKVELWQSEHSVFQFPESIGKCRHATDCEREQWRKRQTLFWSPPRVFREFLKR